VLDTTQSLGQRREKEGKGGRIVGRIWKKNMEKNMEKNMGNYGKLWETMENDAKLWETMENYETQLVDRL